MGHRLSTADRLCGVAARRRCQSVCAKSSRVRIFLPTVVRLLFLCELTLVIRLGVRGYEEDDYRLYARVTVLVSDAMLLVPSAGIFFKKKKSFLLKIIYFFNNLILVWLARIFQPKRPALMTAMLLLQPALVISLFCSLVFDKQTKKAHFKIYTIDYD